MLPRSLSNFMNALTASDHTYYPFATTNPQDFKNLMAVYLDATLHPLLKKSDFAQEGWRIGPEDSTSTQGHPQATSGDSSVAAESQDRESLPKSEKLVFKGVVYNEMKGQMSDAGYLFYVRFMEHIFPDIKNSGGDPSHITDLTYDQLKQFHEHHYHPSNAKIFTYGDMPLNSHLDQVDSYLSSFNSIPIDEQVHRPIDLSSTGPLSVTEYGPTDPLVGPDQQFKSSISWITSDTSNIVESFSLALLTSLLMDGYGSPLYRGLIEAGLGTDWSPNSGYDASGRIGIFSVGLSGMKEADVPQIKPRLRSLLIEARDKGFERTKIDGALHQLELALKHKTANFGMTLLHRLKPRWFSGEDPFQSLEWNSIITAFESELAKGKYLEGLIDKYLLHDQTLSFTMAPSSTYEEEVTKAEQARLDDKIEAKIAQTSSSLTEVRNKLQEEERNLAVEQEKSNTEDLSCLPTVYVKDIERTAEHAVLRDEVLNNMKIQWFEAPTNGLTYFRAISVLEGLPDALRKLIPLFCDSIMRIGTRNMTVEQLEDTIKLRTGGMSVSYHVTPSPADFGKAEEGVMMTGMALDRNVPEMMELLRRVVAETDFDGPETTRKVRELLQASADGLVDSIASSGHQYARGYAESGLTRVAWLSQQVSGLSQARLITSLASRPEADGLEDILAKLKAIQQLVVNGRELRSSVTCGAESVADNLTSLSKFASWALPLEPESGADSLRGVDSPESRANVVSTNALSKNEGQHAINRATFFSLPYQVYYGGLAVATTPYLGADSAPLRLLASILTHKHLHHEIREKGGAYGGGSYASPLGGIFGLYSYRDPNPTRTLAVMRAAGQWAVQRKWTDRDLEEAKISTFKAVDAPRAVDQAGMSRFLSGITEDMKQTHRELLLDTSAGQLRDVAQRYLVDSRGQERVAFLGPRREWVDVGGEWEVIEMDVKSVQTA